ncbi:uncharacterized protein LOC123519472 [Portunus trituberculatus]|uniref:uncharacterized protein LOC123519472 n=1 Tax=Portunus trituberculatus TaxID=210409 RepID=UPI001E1CC879|nr:uncharacterized protein LOC123519472 [Portunus trituberculatus]
MRFYFSWRQRQLCLSLLLSFMVVLMVTRREWQQKRVTLRPPLDPSLQYDNSALIQSVAQNFLHPPSSEPYHLMQSLAETDLHAAKYINYKAEFAYAFCQRAIKKIFDGAGPGFFVEAGALDGEFLSNTLPLEKERGWTGLLVEADGDMFDELLSKRRRAWASHSCLATRPNPHSEILIKYIRQNTLKDAFSNHAARAHNSLLDQTAGNTLDGSMPGHPIYESVQCIPLATLLLATNTTHVDLVSLDVEGAEMGILRNFPWRRVTVDVWVVEHAFQTLHSQQRAINGSVTAGNDEEFIRLFTSRGYEVYEISKDLVIPNYVFVLRGSPPYHRLRATGKLSHTKGF